MQHAPSEVFHYADSRGHSDAILLSRSCSILQAAKKDLLGIIQLQVRELLLLLKLCGHVLAAESPPDSVWRRSGEFPLSRLRLMVGFCCRTPACWRAE